MGIVHKLTEKPWLTPGFDPADEQRAETPDAAALVGLRLYFGVVTVMFLLIAAAYLMHRGVGHDMAGEHEAGLHRLPPLPLLWFNTVILALSGASWELARMAAKTGATARVRSALTVSGALAAIFIGGQLTAWWQLRAIAGASMTAVFFYLISALHGLHLIGGLVAWGRTMGELSADADRAVLASLIRLCTGYWHFLLLVWLAVFALLLSA